MGCYRNGNDVAGASNNRCRGNGDVGGASDNNFKVRVRGTIDGEDFCRAVRRCIANDVAGAEDRNNRRRKGCCWF